MDRFDHASSSAAVLPLSSAPEPHVNGHSSPTKPKMKYEPTHVKSETPHTTAAEDDYDDSDVVSPPKKKRKQAIPVDDDAKLAAMLQAQENSRARPTRGGNEKKRVVKNPGARIKKEKKKKSANKIKRDDDSDLELDSDGEVKEKVKKGGFHVGLRRCARGISELTSGQKQYHLSAPLAELVGEPTVSSVFLCFHAPANANIRSSLDPR